LSTSYTTQPFINFTMKAAVTDAGQAFSGAPYGSEAAKRFTYAWEALSTACSGVTISSPASSSTQMLFQDVSTATVLQHLNTDPSIPLKPGNCVAQQLRLCVSDGEIAREVALALTASASKPELIRQPPSVVQVPGTSLLLPPVASAQLTACVASAGAVDYAISVEGRSLPPPSYQWQMLVNITVNRTSNPVNITTRGLHDSMLPVRGLPKAHRYVGRAAHDLVSRRIR